MSKERHGRDEERTGEMKDVSSRKSNEGGRKRGGGEGGGRRGGGRGRKWGGEGADGRRAEKKEGSKGRGSVLGGPQPALPFPAALWSGESFPRREALAKIQLGKDPPVGSLHFLTLLPLSSLSPYRRLPAPKPFMHIKLLSQCAGWWLAGSRASGPFRNPSVSRNTDSVGHTRLQGQRAGPGCCQSPPRAGQPCTRSHSQGSWPQLPALPRSSGEAGVRQGCPFLPRM